MSLQGFRKNANSLVVKGLLGILVLSFAAWGVGDFITGGRDSTAISVNSERISVYALQKAFQRKKAEVQQQLQGTALTPEIIKMFRLQDAVIREAIQNGVMMSFAKKLGFTVPDAMVSEAIRIQPQFFGADGSFDKDVYKNTLANAGMTTDSFEEMVREDMMRQHLRHPFLDLTFNTDMPLDRILNQLYETRDVRAILITSKDVAAAPEPTEEELIALYSTVKDQHQAPEYRAFDMVVIDMADIIGDIKVDDAQAKEHYDENPAAYLTPETRTVKQLIFSDKKEAQDVLDALKNGAKFDDYLAKQDGSMPNDLGKVSRGQLPLAEMEKAVFSAKKGGTTDMIETPFGFSILHVEDITPEKQQSFAEVKDLIKGAMQRDMAESVFEDTLERAQDAIAGASHLKDITASKRFSLRAFDKVSLEGKTLAGGQVDVPGGKTLLQSVFQSEEGSISEKIQIDDNKIAFVEVTGVVPARTLSLDEVKADIVSLFKQQKTAANMQAKAVELLAKRNQNQSFETILKSADLAEPLQTIPALKRDDAQRNTLITSEIRKTIFATPFKRDNVSVVGQPYKTSDGNMALIEITGSDVELPDEAEISNFKKLVNQAMAQDLFVQFLTALNKSAKVDIRQRMIESALGDTN